MPRSPAFITHGTESAAFQQFGILWQMMATGGQTDGAFCLMDEIMPNVGSGPSTHTHIQDEGLYVVKGQATFNAGGKHGIIAKQGTFMAVPKLTEHSFQVNEANTRLLNFYLPAGFEVILMGLARPAENREPPAAKTIPEMLPPRWVASQLNAEYGTHYKFGSPHANRDNPECMVTEPTPGAVVYPFSANVNEGKRNFHYQTTLWGLLASSEQTGGSYSLFELRSHPGSLYGPRIYKESDTVVFVLAGEMSFFLGQGEPRKAGDGALVWIPRGTLHSIRIKSDHATCLYLQSPGGLESYLQLIGTSTQEVHPTDTKLTHEVPDRRGLELCWLSLGIAEIDVADPLLKPLVTRIG